MHRFFQTTKQKKLPSYFAWAGISLASLFFLLAVLLTFVPGSQSAYDDNIYGWGWSPLLSRLSGTSRSGYGLTSFNDCYCTYNPPSGFVCQYLPTSEVCASDKGGVFGAYGLQANLQTREITGWIWSSGVGWICFGESCCNAGGGQNYCDDWRGDEWEPKNVDPVSGSPQIKVTYEPDQNPAKISGWAKIIAATSTVSWGEKGWISLRGNIKDSDDQYGLRFSTSTLEIRGLAWNAFDTGDSTSLDAMPYHGYGWLCINEEYLGGDPTYERGLCPGASVQVAIPYIQTTEGDVYVRTNITPDLAPPSGKYNATYLILAGGNIQNFISEEKYSTFGTGQYVVPNFPFDISLPNASTNFFNILGKLDIPGIIEPRTNKYGDYQSLPGDSIISGLYTNPNRRVVVGGDLIMGEDVAPGVFTYNLTTDWNYVSPVIQEMDGQLIKDVFTNATGTVWIFKGAYIPATNFKIGEGYFFRNSTPEQVEVNGIPITSLTYRLVGATQYTIGAPFAMNFQGTSCITVVNHYNPSPPPDWLQNWNVAKGEGVFISTNSTALCQFTKSRTDVSVEFSSGATTFVVNGDLHINRNITYGDNPLTSFKDLPSVAFIVFGDVIIDPEVTELAGNFIVLGKDGVNCPDSGCGRILTGAGSEPLLVNGMMMAKKFEMERTYASVLKQASEQVIYDGRMTVNTPPGLQDFAKSLPIWSEVVPK